MAYDRLQLNMFKKNQLIDLMITDQATTGAGIATIKNHPIIIPNTIPGDRIQCKIVKVTPNRSFARLITITKPSPHRVIARCTVANQCGGCQLQHQSKASQLQYKQTLMHTKLNQNIFIKSNHIQPILSHKDPWEFRNKMQFTFAKGPTPKTIHIGLYAARSHRVVNTSHCPIMPATMNQVLDKFREFYAHYPISIFDEKTGLGCLRHITIRYAHATKSMMVILTIAAPLPHQNELINALSNIPSLHSIYTTHQSNPSSDQVLGHNLTLVWGEPTIT